MKKEMAGKIFLLATGIAGMCYVHHEFENKNNNASQPIYDNINCVVKTISNSSSTNTKLVRVEEIENIFPSRNYIIKIAERYMSRMPNGKELSEGDTLDIKLNLNRFAGQDTLYVPPTDFTVRRYSGNK